MKQLIELARSAMPPSWSEDRDVFARTVAVIALIVAGLCLLLEPPLG